MKASPPLETCKMSCLNQRFLDSRWRRGRGFVSVLKAAWRPDFRHFVSREIWASWPPQTEACTCETRVGAESSVHRFWFHSRRAKRANFLFSPENVCLTVACGDNKERDRLS